MSKPNRVHIVLELSDEELEHIQMLVRDTDYEGTSHGALDLNKLMQMLAEDLVLAVRRPGSWEGANIRQVLAAHGYE